jgi:RNA polymerase sigma factor (sigma-70 family)
MMGQHLAAGAGLLGMSQSQATFTIDELLQQVGWLRRLGRGLLAADVEAEDLIQETLVAAWRKPPADRGNPRAWFRTVFTNRVRNEIRRRNADARTVERATAVAPPAESALTPEEATAQLELQRLVADRLLALAPAQREVIYLRYFAELDASEIGRRLQIPAGTVRWRLKEGLAELRRQLDAGDAEDGGAWRRALVPLVGGTAQALPGPANAPVFNSPLARGGAVLGLGAAAGGGLLLLQLLAPEGDGAALEGSSGAGAPRARSELVAPAASPREDRRAPALVPAAVLPGGGGEGGPGSGRPPPRRTSPWAKVTWDGETAKATLAGGDVVAIRGVDGVPMSAIVAFAKTEYGHIWQKRIAEDLIDVMAGMGHSLSGEVALEIDRGGGRSEILTAAMTKENRQAMIRDKAVASPPSASPVDPHARVAPYSDLRFQNDEIHVEVDGAWYRLVAMGGVDTATLIGAAKGRFGERWKKRIAEDPVEVLVAVTGRSPGLTVELVLDERDSNRRVTIPDVALTEEKRRRVRDNWR